jgi:hypothetical protein
MRSLCELVDLYHTRKATDRRDKVYALLGMSSDDPGIAGLSANYEISWGQLFERLIKLFSEQVSADTWNDKEIAVIRGKGCVLGEVSSVKDSTYGQEVNVNWTNVSGYRGTDFPSTFQASAKSVQVGDVVCFLQGASNPTIIRLCTDYWAVIMISVPSPDDLQGTISDTRSRILRSIRIFPHDFLLVWNWDMYLDKSQDGEDYEHFIMGALASTYSNTYLKNYMDKATRLWNTGVVLQDMGKDKAGEYFRKAMGIIERQLTTMGRLVTSPAVVLAEPQRQVGLGLSDGVI